MLCILSRVLQRYIIYYVKKITRLNHQDNRKIQPYVAPYDYHSTTTTSQHGLQLSTGHGSCGYNTTITLAFQ